MRNILILVSIVFLFSGCFTEKHNLTPMNKLTNLPLSKNTKVYIALSEDGRFGQTIYHNSGFTVSNSLKKNIFKYTKDITISTTTKSYQETIADAKQNNAIYLFYPTILHWEDRATQWSGLPDKIHINISVIEISKEKEISSIEIKSNSSFWALTNANPSELIEKPFREYIDTLYGKLK